MDRVENVQFRAYRPQDLKTCARLAHEAFPSGRQRSAGEHQEVTMEGYVESSLMWVQLVRSCLHR
jgi:hypothetical protein